MRILIADTETTGLMDHDEICELAFLEIDTNMIVQKEFQTLIKPTVPMSPTASAVNHITDEDLVDAPGIDDIFSQFPEDYFANVFLIAHNCKFDKRFLSKYWGISGEFCTLRASKSFYPRSPNHQLQTLRYYLKLDVDGGSHRAMLDVFVKHELLKRILQDSSLSLPDLLETSNRPVRIECISFGKHRGALLKDLPASYRRWLLTVADIDDDLRWSLEELK